MPARSVPPTPSAQELRMRSAMIRVAGGRAMQITIRDIEALARSAMRTLPKARPPDVGHGGKPFTGGDDPRHASKRAKPSA
ncbi:hypothetical protein ABH925_001176 [Streptacidiphilus sp. EB129]